MIVVEDGMGRGGRAEVLAINLASRRASRKVNGCANGVIGRQLVVTMFPMLMDGSTYRWQDEEQG